MNIKELKRRLKLNERRLKEHEKRYGILEAPKHTVYCGWDRGYFCGKISVLQDIIDSLEEKCKPRHDTFEL
ncbi:MAG: hypothetical protein FWH05_09305 [Oscillospiraceae bacterium]|nr:hypothetical protein [Oscillospiraceae bacterium]